MVQAVRRNFTNSVKLFTQQVKRNIFAHKRKLVVSIFLILAAVVVIYLFFSRGGIHIQSALDFVRQNQVKLKESASSRGMDEDAYQAVIVFLFLILLSIVIAAIEWIIKF
jgi:hypothetical protein